jgi:hypothetical protein
MSLLTEVPFIFPEQQRVLTEEEYAQLGYIAIGKVAPMDSSKPLGPTLNLPAYRAETKEEALIDIGIGLVKLGYAASTGGVGPAVNTTLGYTWSLLT